MSHDSMSDAGDRSVAFVDQARRQEPDVVSSVSFAPQRTHVEQDQMSVGHSQSAQGSRLSFIGMRGESKSTQLYVLDFRLPKRLCG